MKLPPLSSYAPNFTSHPADARTQAVITQSLTPARPLPSGRSDSHDRVEQFIQAGFAKATALLNQITSSDKPPTLDQLTRYINALTRLATARNAANAAPPSSPKPPGEQSPPAPISRPTSAPKPVPVPTTAHPSTPTTAPNRLPANPTPIPTASQSNVQPPVPAASQTASPPALAKIPTFNPLPSSVNSELSGVNIPLPSHHPASLSCSEVPKKRYKMVHFGTHAPK